MDSNIVSLRRNTVTLACGSGDSILLRLTILLSKSKQCVIYIIFTRLNLPINCYRMKDFGSIIPTETACGLIEISKLMYYGVTCFATTERSMNDLFCHKNTMYNNGNKCNIKFKLISTVAFTPEHKIIWN